MPVCSSAIARPQVAGHALTAHNCFCVLDLNIAICLQGHGDRLQEQLHSPSQLHLLAQPKWPGGDLDSVALHCIQHPQPATIKLRTMAGMLPAHLAAFLACMGSRCCQARRHLCCLPNQQPATTMSNMPQCNASELGNLCISGFCRGTVSWLLQGKRIGVFRSYVNIPTNDQEIVRLFNQAVADLEAGGQLTSSLPLLCTVCLMLCMCELCRLGVSIVSGIVPTCMSSFVSSRGHSLKENWGVSPHVPLNVLLTQMCMHIKQSSAMFTLKSATAAKCALPVPWQLCHLQSRQGMPSCGLTPARWLVPRC